MPSDRIFIFNKVRLLGLLFFLSCLRTAFADDAATNRQAVLEQSIGALEKTNAALQQTNAILEATTKILHQNLNVQQAKLDQLNTNLLRANADLKKANASLLLAKADLAKVNSQLEKAQQAREILDTARANQEKQRDFLGYVIAGLREHQMEVKCIAVTNTADLTMEYIARDKKLVLSTLPEGGSDWPANRPLFKELLKTIAALEQWDLEVCEFVFRPSAGQVVTFSNCKLTITAPEIKKVP